MEQGLLRLVAMVIILTIGLLVEPGRRRSRNRMLGRIARLLGGRLQPGSASRTGGVVWNLEGSAFLLYEAISTWGRPDGFVARLRRPGPTRLRLLPEAGWRRLRKFLGAQDLQLGDSRFDRSFVVQGENPEATRRFLAPPVRQALVQLNGVDRVSVDVGPREIVIRTRQQFLRDPERLSRFASEALTVARAILQSQSPVEIVEVEVNRSGDCPVCGTAVEEDGGLCARCRTPHHKDCWEYLGGCSVFACAGRPARMRRSMPRVAARR